MGETNLSHFVVAVALRLVVWSDPVEEGQQRVRCRRSLNGTLANDLSRGQFLPVELLVGAVVGAQGGSGEVDAGEDAANARS